MPKIKSKPKAMLDAYEYSEEMVPIAEILVDEVETSDGFDNSLKNLGHTTDVVLNKIPLLDKGKNYRVIDGRKTINSLSRNGVAEVKARVYKNLPVEMEKYIIVVRNLQHSASPIVEAEAFKELIDKHKKSQKEIAEITGVTPSVISQRLSMLTLPKSIIEQLRRNAITYSVAKKISSLPKDVQNRIAKEEDITGEIVERYHREHLNSQISFDDVDLPKKPKSEATIRNYNVKCGKKEKDMTRKELMSEIDEMLAGLAKGEELIITRK